MIFKSLTLAAGLSLILTGAASATTLLFTEGNGQNRALVAGSVDLNDAPPGGIGFNLDSYNGGSAFGAGDTIGIYGRIVHSVDRFSYSFSSGVGFNVSFDFDGYDLAAGGSVAAGLSGLIDQSVVTSGGNPKTDGGGKGVTISLFQGGVAVPGLTSGFITNVTSLTAVSASIFSDVAAGAYTLVVDGSNGPYKNRAALYDIEITTTDSDGGPSTVPIPATGLLLLSGLGIIGLRRRKNKTA